MDKNMVKVTYYMSQQQVASLKGLSSLKSLSVGALIRIAINDLLDKENKKNA